MELRHCITIDPNLCGGEPVFNGTRVSVQTVLASLSEGEDPADILRVFPTLTQEHLDAAMYFLVEKIKPPFFKHIVGLGVAYEHIEKGERKPKQPNYFSSTVIAVHENWYILTAGHILEGIDAAIVQPGMELVGCSLDDSYSPSSPEDNTPIPFLDFLKVAPRFYRYEKDSKDRIVLDFGLIRLDPHCRKLLETTGIEPLTLQHWNSSNLNACDTFIMVGFPEDSINSDLSFSQNYYTASVKGAPSCILFDRLKNDLTTCYPRFSGQIRATHKEYVGNIKGMSGGPIFGIKGHNLGEYYIAAIQSSWIESEGITYGCPISVILTEANAFLNENHD